MKRYKVYLGNNTVREVYRKWYDFIFDYGFMGWGANRFRDCVTEQIRWLSKHFTIEIEEVK